MLSPLYPLTPVPAMVVMTPVAWFTSRMRLFSESAMKRFPAASTVTPVGSFSLALTASPPLPEEPEVPFPATVVMTPVM